MLFGYLAFMIVMACILALWEIQIEGKDGWAANSPGWRVEKGWPIKITGGRPVTGYHVFMTLFMIAIVHLPVFFIHWTWRLECLLFGFYIGMMVAEDFLWFVLNPHFGLKKFRKGKIWWHKQWFGPVPVLYWYMLPITGLLIFFGRTAFSTI